MKKKLAVLLAAALTLGMTACGASKGAGDTGKSEKSMVYAVEAGSAGEEAAKEKGFQYNSVSSQADALMEVASGTSDAAIIDLLMAGAMIGEGTSYPNLKHTDELTTEEYGVGCRKGSDLASYINQVFADSYKDGSMEKIAETYGVQEALVEQKDATFEQSPKDSDVDYIKGRGKLVVGVTDFEPMDYKDKDGNYIPSSIHMTFEDSQINEAICSYLNCKQQMDLIAYEDNDKAVIEQQKEFYDDKINRLLLINECIKKIR